MADFASILASVFLPKPTPNIVPDRELPPVMAAVANKGREMGVNLPVVFEDEMDTFGNVDYFTYDQPVIRIARATKDLGARNDEQMGSTLAHEFGHLVKEHFSRESRNRPYSELEDEADEIREEIMGSLFEPDTLLDFEL